MPCDPVTFHNINSNVFVCLRNRLISAGFNVPVGTTGQIKGFGITADFNWDGASNLMIHIISKPIIPTCGTLMGIITDHVISCGGTKNELMSMPLRDESRGKGGKEEDPDYTFALGTARTCKAHLLNNWDVDITNVVFTHTSGVNVDKLEIEKLEVGKTSKEIDIKYETGFMPNHDYWYIEFTADGGSHGGNWKCKTSFWCDLRAGDAGSIVQAMVSANKENMYITESSGQCYVSLHH